MTELRHAVCLSSDRLCTDERHGRWAVVTRDGTHVLHGSQAFVIANAQYRSAYGLASAAMSVPCDGSCSR